VRIVVKPLFAASTDLRPALSPAVRGQV